MALQPKQVLAFGRFLRRLREARNLSQGQVLLALKEMEKKGVGTAFSGSGLSRYESGDREKPDPVVLLCLAAIYETDVTSLISVLAANRVRPTLTDAEVPHILQQVKVTQDADAAAVDQQR